ncbi:type I restriction enzyme S subunit [Chitinophaga polysaccharea]|uniref:Type I restriction enzyme S subunit n=1 Tax=Chitinophaga polysaccharea TaxID=1293035 RepID=A0A561Q2U3_9BACT|nr:restriction endonuclease subunit S [Chitinophaga polysaccharea]TWF44682.1 type I restriction enzyme S subunit [Chitinophaga polysaccharea]
MKKGWETKKLKEVCEKITDGTHQTPKYFDKGIIFLSSKNVTSGKIDWENVKYIDEKQHLEMHRRVAPKMNDILLAKNGTTGVAAIVDRNEVFDIYVSLAHIRVLEEIMPHFMLYFLNSPLAKRQFDRRLKGIGVPNLHLEEIREVVIPFPKSLEEQKQIVAILDKAFAAIDRAKANVAQNLRNANELFESYLNEVFENKGEGWEETTLENIVSTDCTLSYGIVQPGDEFENGLPIVRPTDLNSKIIFKEGLKLVNPERADSYSRTTLKGGDILMCVRGTTGTISIASTELKGANVTRGIVPINFNSKILDQSFGYYLLKSNYIQKQIRKKTYGAALMQINIGDLRKIRVLYPPLLQQKRFVQKFDIGSTQTHRLDLVYGRKIADLEELKKSILQKAFSGELTHKPIHEQV